MVNAKETGSPTARKPGKGGVSRGRGDADLNYGHETDEQGIKFKETVLPKGYLDDPSEEVSAIDLFTSRSRRRRLCPQRSRARKWPVHRRSHLEPQTVSQTSQRREGLL